ncbi:phosphatase [Nesidiocoris tenuis]|uniref:Phosphatase n=1 Tax=Nesidiocoris tenuis TaxID=355587 RepID=A0ABN7BFN4_9HEMI|nr:phosphatase [Nesidiocoris tenuis]
MSDFYQANNFSFPDDKLPAGFPQITQQPTTKVIEMGHTAVLVCAANGKPVPAIRWVKDLLPVQIGKNARYTILNNSQMPGALQITNSVEDDQGRYECVAENEVGTEYSQATMLYVKCK